MKKIGRCLWIVIGVLLCATAFSACYKRQHVPHYIDNEVHWNIFNVCYIGDYGSDIYYYSVPVNCQDLSAIFSPISDRDPRTQLGYEFHGFFDGDTMLFDADGLRVEGISDDDLYNRAQANRGVLRAKQTPKTFTIRFDSGEGTPVADRTNIVYNTQIDSFATPVPPVGKRFVGWFRDEERTKYVTNGRGKTGKFTYSQGQDYLPIEEDTTVFREGRYLFNQAEEGVVVLYAKYEDYKPVVSFDFGSEHGEQQADSLTLSYNASVENLPTAEQGDFAVRGWKYDQAGQRPYNGEGFVEDTTLYAVWKQFKTVTLWNGQTKLKEVRVFEGDYLYTDEGEFIVEIDGYGFDGWYADRQFSDTMRLGVSAFGDSYTDLYGKFVQGSYTVTYVTSGSIVDGQQIPQRKFAAGERFRLYDFADDCPAHYTFKGWSVDAEEKSDPFLNVFENRDYTLYPVFKGDDIRVTLDMNYTADMIYNDGKHTDTATVEYGSEFSFAPPENLGYTFVGWFTDGDVPLTDPNGKGLAAFGEGQDTTLHAKWEKGKNVYTVRFMSDGKEVGKQYVEAGEKLKMPASVPEKQGYTFLGWFNKAGTAQYRDTDEVHFDLVLYAKWQTEDA